MEIVDQKYLVTFVRIGCAPSAHLSVSSAPRVEESRLTNRVDEDQDP